MKRVARIERQDNTIEIVRVKTNAQDFKDRRGNTYNVASWKMRKALLGPVQEATYVEGVPNPISIRAIKDGQAADTEAFTGRDYENLHGDPIIRWLTIAMKRAQGDMLFLYIAAGAGIVAAICGLYLAINYHNHPWR